jgi:hypothetical protein
MVRVRGEWTAEKVYQAVEQAKLCEIDPDKIIIAGPGNSQVKHGRTEVRGYGPEKKIMYKKDRRIVKEFQLTGLTKTTVREKGRGSKLSSDNGRGPG